MIKNCYVTFEVNCGEYTTKVYFKTNKKVTQLDETSFSIGNLIISTHEPITSISFEE